MIHGLRRTIDATGRKSSPNIQIGMMTIVQVASAAVVDELLTDIGEEFIKTYKSRKQ
jgi:hypothetical protein